MPTPLRCFAAGCVACRRARYLATHDGQAAGELGGHAAVREFAFALSPKALQNLEALQA